MIVGFLLMGLVLLPSVAHATVFYDTSAENRTCDTVISNTNVVDGKMWIVYPDPGAKPSPYVRCSLTPPDGSKYFEFQTIAAGIDGNGRCTPANTEAQCTHDAGVEIPMTSTSLSMGQVMYLGVFVRNDRISNRDIWVDATGTQPDSWDKCFEMVASSFRWGIGCGWPAGILTATDGKYSFDAWCSTMGGTFSNCDTVNNYLHKSQNANGYTNSTPFLADYGNWYAVVLEVTLNTTTAGRVRLYVNGTAITDVSIITTAASPTLDHMFLYGTISQPDYDSPDHYIRFDRLMLTDSLTDITNAGLMSDPEAGGGGGGGSTATTPSAGAMVTFYQLWVAVTTILQWGVVLGYFWERRATVIRALIAIHIYYWTVRYRWALARWQRQAPLMLEHRGEYVDLVAQKDHSWRYR